MPTIQSEDEFYQAIEQEVPTLVVFGIVGERWTDVTMKFFGLQEVQVSFVPWDDGVDLRLSLELQRYPVAQLWQRGRLLTEQVGYHRGRLQLLADQYFKTKRGFHGKGKGT